jgi:hypothetical protein
MVECLSGLASLRDRRLGEDKGGQWTTLFGSSLAAAGSGLKAPTAVQGFP